MTTETGYREPGIYLNLSNADYHRDRSLGSTNLRMILRSPPAYWWGSYMNPLRPDDDDDKSTPDATRGQAIHTFLLEGGKAFHDLYMRRPDDDKGASSADKSAVTKAANAAAKTKGKTSLHGSVWDRVLISARMITANPELANAFTGGIPEVSVFWQRKDGTRLKARFDYLKPRAITDLKTIANILKIDFVQACKIEIARRNHPAQAALYIEGRRQVPALFADGKVFDALGRPTTTDNMALLAKIAGVEEFAFAWIFYSAKDAPLTWGTTVSPANPVLEFARGQIDDAIEKFNAYRERFGETMWVLREPLAELEVEDLPDWYGQY